MTRKGAVIVVWRHGDVVGPVTLKTRGMSVEVEMVGGIEWMRLMTQEGEGEVDGKGGGGDGGKGDDDKGKVMN